MRELVSIVSLLLCVSPEPAAVQGRALDAESPRTTAASGDEGASGRADAEEPDDADSDVERARRGKKRRFHYSVTHTRRTSGSERVVMGGDVVVEAGEVVDEAVAVGGSVLVRGRVEGDAVAVGGSVHVEDGGVVEGEIVAVGGEVIVEPGGQALGDRVNVGGAVGGLVRSIVGMGTSHGPMFGAVFGVLATLVRAVALLVVGLLLLAFVPERVERVRSYLHERTGHAALGGLGILLGIVPLCALLLVTIVGIPLIPLVGLIVSAMLALGLTALCVGLGQRLPGGQSGRSVLRAFLLGLLLIALVDFIPFVGTPVVAVAAFIAAGAVLLSRFGAQAPPSPPALPATAS